MKKIFKYLGVLLLVAIIGISAFLIQVWYFKPISINHFFAKTAIKFAIESPEMLSSIRVFEKFGIDGHNAKLDDASMASGDKMFKQLNDTRQTLLTYEDEDLDETKKLSKDIMLSLLDIAVDGEKFRFHNYPMNQLFGIQNGFPSFMESTHQIHETDDAKDYITRLSLIDTKFDQVLTGLKHREDIGVLPPQFVITKVLEEMRGFIGTPVEENILIDSMVKKMEKAEFSDEDLKHYGQLAAAEVKNTVYPAYQKLIDYYVALDDKVEGNYGVWHLPNGDEFYRLALKFFTTTDYTPDYIHQLGLKEVDRIQAEITAILAQQGRDVS